MVIAAFVDAGTILLEHNTSTRFAAISIELPAGKIDPGEPRTTTARIAGRNRVQRARMEHAATMHMGIGYSNG